MSVLTKPVKFDEALKRLKSLKPLHIALSSAQWAAVPEQIRESAFFTANVESANVLSRLQGLLKQALSKKLADTPRGKALAVSSKQAFVDIMQPWMIRNGFADDLPKGVPRGKRGAIAENQDLGSLRRLSLIFDTQQRKAWGFGSMKLSTDDRIVNAFPAWRFVRGGSVKEPRPDHKKHENAVRLKSDKKFWIARNNPKFGGFGVPYGPWGFNSQMDVVEVSRSEAVRLGLLAHNQKLKVKGPRFNESTRASIRSMDPEMVNKLKQSLGDKIDVVDDEIRIKKGKQ